MGSTLLENLAIDEQGLLEYPITRMEAACRRWARRTSRTTQARKTYETGGTDETTRAEAG